MDEVVLIVHVYNRAVVLGLLPILSMRTLQREPLAGGVARVSGHVAGTARRVASSAVSGVRALLMRLFAAIAQRSQQRAMRVSMATHANKKKMPRHG
ncbi:hypothetical protein [Xanthomonas melonis]|uniref:hypothetical protein n=1 Tax=Xanthomonas melonis TaxID=56456 RepID=UPI001AC00306|nr:hypothetical protein [Xanthomonas melonis]